MHVSSLCVTKSVTHSFAIADKSGVGSVINLDDNQQQARRNSGNPISLLHLPCLMYSIQFIVSYPALFMKAKTGKTKPNIYPPIYGGTNLISKK